MVEEGRVQDWTAIPIEDLVDQLVASGDEEARCYANEIAEVFSIHQLNNLTEALKDRCIQSFGENFQTAQRCADLVMEIAEQSGNDIFRALGLRLCAQVLMLGRGEFRQALDLYEQALDIHRQHNDQVGQAQIYTTSIWAMANLGRYEQAVKKGEWACGIFEEKRLWKDMAKVQTNLAAIHNRTWEYERALENMNHAQKAYEKMGEEGETFLAHLETNRAIALFNLSQYHESLEASKQALTLASKHHQTIIFARAQHNKAFTCFFMGEYNLAMDLLIQARNCHQGMNQQHEAALCELTRVDFLLSLGRYENVLHLIDSLIPLLRDLEMYLELAEATYYEAMGYLGCGEEAISIETLNRAKSLFLKENVPVWVAQCDLDLAQILYKRGDLFQSIEVATIAMNSFDELGLNYERVQSRLSIARITLQIGEVQFAENILMEADEISSQEPWPELIFEIHRLRGVIAQQRNNIDLAVREDELALTVLSYLRVNVMMEYRPGFLQDKSEIFTHLVSLYLILDRPDKALETVERAKSLALIEILTNHSDITLHTRHPDDRSLVERIHNLTVNHKLASKRVDTLRFEPMTDGRGELLNLKERILSMEKEITDLWHQLLIRNNDYELDASLWEPLKNPFLLNLEEGTMLVEYFYDNEGLLAFLSFSRSGEKKQDITCIRLPGKIEQIERLLQRFWVNLGALHQDSRNINNTLIANVKGILLSLNHLLLEPFSHLIEGARHLVVVPFGKLHYLPFHALFDGQKYLVEKIPIRYIPASSLLRFYQNQKSSSSRCLVIGHSFYGRLRHTSEEACEVAKIWGVQPYMEDLARTEHLKKEYAGYRLIHLACHGEFHPENPLFSGLALDDNWLTTLDIFNLKLNASLVTLSACQTGRSNIEGGDELSGLMRAFLSAGVISLVISLWSVQDQATLVFMRNFYKELAKGVRKDKALQRAQVEMICGGTPYSHPFYWAPFYLVGDGGKIS